MPPVPAPLAAQAYAARSLAAGTLDGYRTAWDDFTAWCRLKNLSALPTAPATVADYLASLAVSHGRSALTRRLAAIGQAHRLKGEPWDAKHPLIRHTMRGILRAHGQPARQAAALSLADLKKLLATCQHDLVGIRDRAMILLGYAGALRRSELVAIERAHLTFAADGIRLMLPRAKTDPEGQGAEIGIARGEQRETCPMRAVQDWLEASRCEFGPVFRKIDQWGGIDDRALQPNAVRLILKRRAEKARVTVGPGERLTAHCLRVSMITTAANAGVRDSDIMAHSRHRDVRTMHSYIRRGKLLDETPSKKLGL